MEVEGAGAFTTSSGIGVHNCIPLDPFYLAWRAREAGVPTRFIELAGEINTSMPGYVIDKLQAALNEREKALKGAKILILGLAYKPNIDDPRESPAFEIIDQLLGLGAEVSYHDPHIPVAPKMRSWPDLPPMESVALTDRDPAEHRRRHPRHRPQGRRLRPRPRTRAVDHRHPGRVPASQEKCPFSMISPLLETSPTRI